VVPGSSGRIHQRFIGIWFHETKSVAKEVLEVLGLMFTRRGQITLLAIAIALVALALAGIIVVVIVHGFKAETAALITAWATVVGVLIAQAVTARLAAERAQVDELQAYLKEMGDLLSGHPDLRDPASGSVNTDLRILARAHTRTVWSGLNRARRRYVLNYLRETQLLDALGLGDLVAQVEHPSGVESPSGVAESDQYTATTQPMSALESALRETSTQIFTRINDMEYSLLRRLTDLEYSESQRTASINQRIDSINQRSDSIGQLIGDLNQRVARLSLPPGG
jgi:hypothetical protein